MSTTPSKSNWPSKCIVRALHCCRPRSPGMITETQQDRPRNPAPSSSLTLRRPSLRSPAKQSTPPSSKRALPQAGPRSMPTSSRPPSPTATVASIDRVPPADKASRRPRHPHPLQRPQSSRRCPAPASRPPHPHHPAGRQHLSYNGQPHRPGRRPKSLDRGPPGRHACSSIKYAPQPAKLDFMGRLDEARWPKQPGKEPPGNKRGDLAERLRRLHR